MRQTKAVWLSVSCFLSYKQSPWIVGYKDMMAPSCYCSVKARSAFGYSPAMASFVPFLCPPHDALLRDTTHQNSTPAGFLLDHCASRSAPRRRPCVALAEADGGRMHQATTIYYVRMHRCCVYLSKQNQAKSYCHVYYLLWMTFRDALSVYTWHFW